MSNPYITKKDLKEILDDYDFGGNKYSSGSAGGFAGDDKLGGWAKWINERVNSTPFNSSASDNGSNNKDSAAQSSSDVNSTQGSAFGGIFNSLGGRQNANGLFGSNSFITGIVLGAAATYFLTDENAQKKLFKLIAKGTEMFQMGVEEMKERFEDAKAEMQE
ncbi:hypothetical protein [uncultured Campylobacter sp.]|mgnify:FL=1|uniref:hypothetical protein n=1 Tax=uncultured Campylobacter sp. TaxID=218934 RepID=UPI002604E688|nr:hypothetical protein [uncultured Campylobacter sp.]